MKIGLLFGSYNPVHAGHLLLATRMREYAELDEVWLVVSPHNPHKIYSELADGEHRLEMARLATLDHPFIKVCALEFELPRPSYTYQTLTELTKLFSDHAFSVIIGEDILEKFDTWKEISWIKNNFKILIYNRVNSKSTQHPASIIHLPLIDITATEIRQRIRDNKTVRYFMPDNVEQYIQKNRLYK